SYEGNVKVVDFGVAKAENRVQETRSGTVKGKIAYLSPEQCRGAYVDRRSDLFSLGIVFWEMLTVERLYKRASDFDNMTAIVTEEPPPPSSRRPGISPELDHIVLRLLSKDPNRRYQNGDELIEALEEVGPKLGTMISTSSVGRFLRDLFGQRPEPWLEMDSTTVQPQSEGAGVTVTSEPVPRELVAAPEQSIDHMLLKVRDLTSRLPDDVDPLVPARSQLLTVQAMPVASADLVETLAYLPPSSAGQRASGAMQPIRAHRGTGSPIDVRSPHTLHDVRSGPIGPGMMPPGEGFASPTGSSSGEHAFSSSGTSGVHPQFPGAGSSSDAHAYPSGSHAGYPVRSQAHGQPQAEPRPASSRRWPLIAIVAIAAVLGSLTVWFVMRGSSSSTVPDAASVALADAIAAEPDLAPTVIADVAVAVADAAERVMPDAADPVTPDAAVAVTPDATVAPVPERDPLLVAFDDKRYSDVVATCSRTMASEHASVCTLAACRTGQDAKAQRWYTKVTTGKRTVAASCREVGIDVAPKIVRPPPKPDAGIDPCAANPMNCQR
nr:protein kinase [Deltaproteobacteria bacterium]